MAEETMEEKVHNLLDELLDRARTPEEQIKALRDCLEYHCLQHPWADEELIENMCENISNEYDLSWDSFDDSDKELDYVRD